MRGSVTQTPDVIAEPGELTELYLAGVTPGKVVEIKTGHSTFWVVPVKVLTGR